MNKKSQMLYLSGLITEEQLAENSDFEHSMASVQKMQSEFHRLSETLSGCLESCEALEKQAMANYSFHDKAGMNRLDSNGIGDAQYFEDVLRSVQGLTKSIQNLFGNGKPINDLEESFQELLNRLNADFDPV